MMHRFFQNLTKYHKYAVRSAKAELKSEVSDSRLNWLWWVVEPLCFMLIYTFVFGYIFGNKDPHFASFVMMGLPLWDFFNRMVSGSSQLIVKNRGLVTKVYIPKYILLYSKSLTYLFKMTISLALAFGLMFIQGVSPSFNILFLLPIIVVLYIISFGIGLLLMHFGVTFDDLAKLTNIGLRMVFYLSGVFYNLNTRVGGHLAFVLLRANPIAFLMSEARKVTLDICLPSFEGLAFWLAIGLVLVCLGVHVIHKYENSYAKVI